MTQEATLRPYIFRRKGTFYVIELKDDEQAKANAECNPGTIAVEDATTGNVVWTDGSQN